MKKVIASDKKKTPQKSPTKLLRNKDIPASKGMLDEMRSEFGAKLTSLELKMDARFKKVDARFNKVDARFNQVDARFNQVDAAIKSLSSDIQQLTASMHKMALTVEEQNVRNKFVLDGLSNLYERQDKLEATVDKRISSLEDIILKKSKSTSN